MVTAQVEQSKGETDSSLVLCAITDRDASTEHSVSVFADMMQAKVTQPKSQIERRKYGNGQTRGEVTTFSRRSRKRMLERVAMKRDKSRLLFFTLTYRDDVWFDASSGASLTPRDLQRHLENFLKRIERAYPHAGILWRKEYAVRRSGDYVGHVVPHIHILVDGIMDDIADVRRDTWASWHEISTDQRTDQFKRSRVDVQAAKSMKQAYYYLSKYLAKSDNRSNSDSNSEDNENVSASLIEEYLAAHAGEIGRHWGVRGNWNVAPVETVRLTHEQFVQLKRECRKFAKRRNPRYAKLLAGIGEYKGFSIFGLGDQTHRKPLCETPIMRLLNYVKATWP